MDFFALLRVVNMYFSIASFVSKNSAAVKMTLPSYLCNTYFLKGLNRIIKNKQTNNLTELVSVSTHLGLMYNTPIKIKNKLECNTINVPKK
jgi:hypothetical protein